MKKQTTLALLLLLALFVLAAGNCVAMSGEEVYQKSCASCHDNGIAGAPKLDDSAAWESRLKGGKEQLYQSSLQGKGSMPAKGGNSSLKDDEVKAAVDYMVEQAVK